MFLKIAWRNLWRNPRRAGIVTIAVIIGVWSMIVVLGMNSGMLNAMTKNGIANLTGDIQIQHKGHYDDPVIKYAIDDPQKKNLYGALKKILPSNKKWTSRIRVNTIIQNATHTAGAALVGIIPQQEKGISFIGEPIYKGNNLTLQDTNGILIGKALADEMETGLGRKLVLMSQDVNGKNVSRAFHIKGIFRSQLEANEKAFVFVTLSAAQNMLNLTNGITEVSILLPENQKLESVAKAFKDTLSANTFEIFTWKELLPLLVYYLQIFQGVIYIWFIVIAIAMSFGIVNTMLMAVFERIREFGILKSLGMKPWQIIREVLTESSILQLIGIIIGNIFGLATHFYFAEYGLNLNAVAKGAQSFGMPHIIYSVLSIKDVILSNLFIFILGIIVSLYPAIKAARFTAIKALNHI